MPAVIGAGSWGTTLAGVLTNTGEPVKLYARDPAFAATLNKERCNKKYLPSYKFPDNLTATADLKAALEGEAIVVHAVPSKATREAAAGYAKHLAPGAVVVSATKGLERETHYRMSEVIAEETGHYCAAITGPNHAEEVSAGQPTAAVIAFPDLAVAEDLVASFKTWAFRTYPRRDIIGTEICGAYKNVVAVAGGMASGLGWGDNCQAALVTLGIDEMMDLTRFLGGDERTVHGLAGIGDLVATATSSHSRNRRYGEFLAQGLTASDIEAQMNGMVAEGAFAVRAFEEFYVKEKMHLPLTHTVYQVVHEEMPVMDAVQELMSRV